MMASLFFFCSLCLILIVQTNTLWVDEMENDGLFEGDIVLDPEERLALLRGDEAAFASKTSGRWDKGIVPYVIDSSLRNRRNDILRAIEQYHQHTCLKFKPRSGEWSYIKFKSGSGCSSPVGKRGLLGNTITLGRNCFRIGTVMHEIGHSLGLYHEQSRPDRDQYIEILWGNIPFLKKGNFKKRTDVNSLGTPYDFGSMMHYSGYAFGNGRQTIRTKDSKYQRVIGQRNGFSPIDITQINLMYKCKNQPTTSPSIGPPTGDCNDKEPQCLEWAKDGFCTNPKEANYMKTKCCKACKESAVCPDKHSRCQEWAERGECKINPPYMLRNCKKSCKVCT